MDSFEYTTNPGRVVFGSGSLQKLPAEIARLNVSTPLLLSTLNQVSRAEQLKTVLNEQIAGIFSEATMHTPTHITDKAVAYAQETNADSVVSIGGGSTIGLGKAISIRTGLPHICIPTTYAGSEMTPILGETADGQKTTRSDPKILPATVIYDVDLTLTLPPGLTATSGVNAIAHAVEALYARTATPITTLHALESIRLLSTSLPALLAPSQTPSQSQSLPSPSPSPTTTTTQARTTALYAAHLAATCLASVGMSLHHKLCHALGGVLNLPHAATHAIVLPHALAYNAPAVPEVMAKLAGVLPSSGDGDAGDAVARLDRLVRRLGLGLGGKGLRELGMREGDVEAVVEAVMGKPYWNPRVVEREGVREVLRRAWAGEEARADL